MKIKSKSIKIKSKKYCEFLDITKEVKDYIKEIKIKNGLVTIFVKHTSCGIRINEKESCFFDDFKKTIDKLIPKNQYYMHNDLKIRTENLVCSPGATDCINGHSHCQTMLLNTSESVPIENGEMILGTWQRILFFEADDSREREIYLQVIGEIN